jgi:hypothetical protein
MDITRSLRKITAGALLVGGLAIPGLGFNVTIAHADTFSPHH